MGSFNNVFHNFLERDFEIWTKKTWMGNGCLQRQKIKIDNLLSYLRCLQINDDDGVNGDGKVLRCFCFN